VYRVRRDITRPRFELKELGEIDMELPALDLVTDDGKARPAVGHGPARAAVQRRHECDADGRLAAALRGLLG
jgi:hypothetical protein